MSLKLFNSMGKNLQEFKPIKEGFVGFYGCGPTVYNYAHIGNLRAYVFLDILDKTLTFLGYKIRHVMNITDIGHLSGDDDSGEDKMLKTAAERHQSVLEVAQFYTDAFFRDIERLNIRRPDVVCKATEHVEEMISLIKKIEANGHTYKAGGNLYFDVSTYADYGKLANLNIEELKAGARVGVDENKKNPSDFVLWFTKSKFENQALTWDSPWGRGYPGWHIECSAMSQKYLGTHFDIHTGGIDHVPVHHTNEIAQSEGAMTAEERAEGPWVNFWLHNEFLVIAKDSKEKSSENSPNEIAAEKMSKSSGNFLTLQSLIDAGYDALDYRYFLLGTHYRSPSYFSFNALDGAAAARKSLVNRAAKIIQESGGKAADENALQSAAKKHLEEFRAALENDLSTPQALAALQVALKDSNVSASEAHALIQKMDAVLGLKIEDSAKKIAQDAQAQNSHQGDSEAAEIDALLAKRAEAKKSRDFATADKIREELSSRGITIVDTPQGTIWKRKE
ncbi:MAG: cysteine--tRNA ligase [Treponemataceae bacterium]|nr:cysteine--tRNA ligase [Treponemataceae bacterium]